MIISDYFLNSSSPCVPLSCNILFDLLMMGMLGYTVDNVGLHGGSDGLQGGVLGYMVGSVELHGGEC